VIVSFYRVNSDTAFERHEAPLGVFGIWDMKKLRDMKKLPGYGIFEEKVIGIQDIEK